MPVVYSRRLPKLLGKLLGEPEGEGKEISKEKSVREAAACGRFKERVLRRKTLRKAL